MPSNADELIDRRRLRRKLTFWRVAAIAIAAAALAFSAMRLGGFDSALSGDHIARIRIEGTINENEDLLERLREVAESERVKGVMLTIDSPGGTTAGGEAIFEAIRRISEQKPVVAQVGTLAASAGYMIAAAADHIVARQSSIVGSIGVLVQFPDFTGLMEKLGIGMEEIKSSPLKAEPNPFSPTTETERAMIRRMVMDSYDWFVDLVTERRPLERSQVLALADGSIFTGRQALQNGLVDALGGEDEAKKWLEEKLGQSYELLEWKPRSGTGVTDWIAALVDLPATSAGLLAGLGAERIFLDGLVSVWQPEKMGSGRQ